MKDKMNSELAKLQEELESLDKAVKHIEKAGTISTEVVEAIRNIQLQYGQHLDSVLKTYDDFINRSYQTYQKEIEEVEGISKTHKEQIAKADSFLNNHQELINKTATLAKQIDNVNFPARLDLVEESIAQMKQEIENTQILNVSSEETIRNDIAKQDKKINILIILVAIGIIASLGMGFLVYLNLNPVVG
jgi:uncharacterized protein YutE (UPF0331/DUF86 family)